MQTGSGEIEIGSILVSSIEYPGNLSLVVFTAGCMLCCPYCHNPDLLDGGKTVKTSEVLQKIDESLDFIDSLVVTGGEPLMQYKEVLKIIKHGKSRGLKVKLDTNGYFTVRLREVLEWVDYVALDVKAPFNRYNDVIGDDIGQNVKESMGICRESDVWLECRTTYVPELLNPEDVVDIARNLDCDEYTIQQFKNKVVLDARLEETPNPTRAQLMEIGEKVKPYLKRVKIKTSEFGEEVVD